MRRMEALHLCQRNNTGNKRDKHVEAAVHLELFCPTPVDASSRNGPRMRSRRMHAGPRAATAIGDRAGASWWWYSTRQEGSADWSRAAVGASEEKQGRWKDQSARVCLWLKGRGPKGIVPSLRDRASGRGARRRSEVGTEVAARVGG